jgi:trimeric autotransporter adhesin
VKLEMLAASRICRRLSGTIGHFQDNQAQTNFWATFMAEANDLGTQLNAEATSNSAADAKNLITEIQNYEQFSNTFDSQQGGVFEARFDNELKVISPNAGGTVLADSQAAINALNDIINGTNVSNADSVLQAAATGFHDNAADVSGNNIPNGGSNFNENATTVAGATTPNGLAMGTIPVTSNPNVAHGTGAGGSSGGSHASGSGVPHGHQDTGPTHVAHFEHLWHF